MLNASGIHSRSSADNESAMGELFSCDASAQRYVLECWIKENPTVWNFIERKVLEDADSTGHASIALAFEHARTLDISNNRGRTFKLNNNMKAAMGRYLIGKYPSLRGKLKTRKSKCDWAFE